jgi:TRAP-type C4-dicarboxylate transport system substrate-binding protein
MMSLRAAVFVPPHNPGTVLLNRLAPELRERSGGRLALEVFDSEKLGPTAGQYDLARTGGADLAYMIHSATPGRFPLTELAHLPFAVADARSGTRGLQGLVPGLLADEHAEVKLLFLVANSPMAIHSLVPIRSVADLRGKRIAHTGRVIGATLEALGATPVPIMPLQVRAALADGRIDGTSMTYEAALVIRLAEAVKSSFDLGANTLTFALVMNRERYGSLDEMERRAVDEVLGPSAGERLADALERAADEGREYMKGAGVEIAQPGAADREALRAAARAVTERFVAGNPQAKQVLDRLTNQREAA